MELVCSTCYQTMLNFRSPNNVPTADVILFKYKDAGAHFWDSPSWTAFFILQLCSHEK